jgi:hypothetical protein
VIPHPSFPQRELTKEADMPGKTAQTLRSDTIVHWTGGKDIEADYKSPAKPKYYGNCEARRVRYLERLKGTLTGSPESNGRQGLWMKEKPISCYIKNPHGGYGRSGTAWPYTCFTEAKPEESLKHMEHYGYLGFGFSREFMLRHYGAPALYVPGVKEMPMVSGDDSDTIVSRHIVKIIKLSEFLRDKTVELKKRILYLQQLIPRKGDPVYCKFEKFIKACHLQERLEDLRTEGYIVREEKDWRLFPAIGGSALTIAVYLKAMSEEDSTHPFELMDEFEWRIPFINGKKCFKATGLTDLLTSPPYVIPFGPCDLKIVIVPDREVRELALKDKDIFAWFGKSFHKIKTVKQYITKP